MGKELYDEHRIVQEYFEEAADCSGTNFVKLCFASSDAELAEIPHAALALYLWGAASSALVFHQGITVDGVAGCDIISWYAALHSVEAVTFPDGLYIIRKWAELYTVQNEQTSYRCMVIASTDPAVRTMVQASCERLQAQGKVIHISRITPDSIVITGEHDAIVSCADTLQHQEPTIELKYYDGQETADVFLSEDMVTQLLQYLEKIDFREPRFPIAHPFTRTWLTTSEELKAIARDICTQTFRVDNVMRELQKMEEMICAVPSLKTRSYYTAWLPQSKLWVMDTKEELQALTSAHVIRDEEVNT